MKGFPPLPALADAPPALLERGHLWIQEYLDCAPLRFTVRESGLVVFGGRERVFRDDIPLEYRHAARHVRERLDRGALRAGVDDVEAFTFLGAAMHRRTLEYDWDRTPSFVGFDVWSDEREAYLPADVVERAFDRLGLAPVDAFEKEVPAEHFDPDGYEIPASAWRDGPAAGVVVRNKNGPRAKLLRPAFRKRAAGGADAIEGDPEELADRLATERRLETAVRELEAAGRTADVGAVRERVVDLVVREEYGRIRSPRVLETRAFRSAVASRVRRYLASVR